MSHPILKPVAWPTLNTSATFTIIVIELWCMALCKLINTNAMTVEQYMPHMLLLRNYIRITSLSLFMYEVLYTVDI